MKKVCYIVGNKSQFCTANIMAYDEFIDSLRKNIYAIQGVEFSIGQGLSKQQINTILCILSVLGA